MQPEQQCADSRDTGNPEKGLFPVVKSLSHMLACIAFSRGIRGRDAESNPASSRDAPQQDASTRHSSSDQGHPSVFVLPKLRQLHVPQCASQQRLVHSIPAHSRTDWHGTPAAANSDAQHAHGGLHELHGGGTCECLQMAEMTLRCSAEPLVACVMHSPGRQRRHIRCGASVSAALRFLQESAQGLHRQPPLRLLLSLPVTVQPPSCAFFAACCLRRHSVVASVTKV